MLKGGVIMDVVTAEQARIAESAGAAAVMALERVPADIRAAGGVARMSDPSMIEEIQEAVTIPVMAKARIGHFAEAQVLEALEVDYIDESEVLTPADEAQPHRQVARSRSRSSAAPRTSARRCAAIGEGAAMIRTKGEAGTGNVVEAVRHMRAIQGEIRRLASLEESELAGAAKELGAPLDLVRDVAERGPPAGRQLLRRRHRHPRRRRADDAARRRGRVRRLGHLQVRGPGAHGAPRSSRPPRTSTTRERVARASRDLGAAMAGLEIAALERRRRRADPAPRLVARWPIGVLALQGDFEAHASLLERLGAEPRDRAHARATSTGSTAS